VVIGLKSIKKVKKLKSVMFSIGLMAWASLSVAHAENTTQAESKGKVVRTGIVEVANFFCPHCYAAEKYAQELRQYLASKDEVFQFVPWFIDAKSQQAAMIYLSANTDKAMQDKLRLGLFTATNAGADFSTGFKGCTSINMFIPEYSIKACTDSLMSNKAIFALKKTLTLLKTAYHGQLSNLEFPIFIVIKNDKVIGKMSYADTSDVAQLVSHVKAMLED